jgi:hypothetical protein
MEVEPKNDNIRSQASIQILPSPRHISSLPLREQAVKLKLTPQTIHQINVCVYRKFIELGYITHKTDRREIAYNITQIHNTTQETKDSGEFVPQRFSVQLILNKVPYGDPIIITESDLIDKGNQGGEGMVQPKDPI